MPRDFREAINALVRGAVGPSRDEPVGTRWLIFSSGRRRVMRGSRVSVSASSCWASAWDAPLQSSRR